MLNLRVLPFNGGYYMKDDVCIKTPLSPVIKTPLSPVIKTPLSPVIKNKLYNRVPDI